MLRGLGRVFRRVLDCGGCERYKKSVHATDLFGSGVSGRREHGREDIRYRAAYTLPVQVGGCWLFFWGCTALVSATVASATRFACFARRFGSAE